MVRNSIIDCGTGDQTQIIAISIWNITLRHLQICYMLYEHTLIINTGLYNLMDVYFITFWTFLLCNSNLDANDC